MGETVTGDTNVPSFEERLDAPVVYFDLVGANGTMNGAIQIELAHRIMTPLSDGSVKISFSAAGRLRCCPTAARALIEGLEKALMMLEPPQEAAPPIAPTKLN